jgi:hypothetical protein
VSIYLSSTYLPTYLSTYLTYLPTYLLCLSMAIQLYVKPWPLLSFLIPYTDGRTTWTSDQPVARPLPTHRTTQTQNKYTQTSIPEVGIEPTIPVFEQPKTFHSLDRAATMIGTAGSQNLIFHGKLSFTQVPSYRSTFPSFQIIIFIRFIRKQGTHDFHNNSVFHLNQNRYWPIFMLKYYNVINTAGMIAGTAGVDNVLSICYYIINA